MRKIALLHPLPARGKPRNMLTIAEGLAARGWSVDLVVFKARGGSFPKVPQEVTLHDLGNREDPVSFFRLVNYIRREHPTVILTRSYYAGVIALFARHVARVPVRAVVGVGTTLSMLYKDAHSLWGKVFPLLARFLYPRADAIVAISQGVKDDLVRFTGKPLEKVEVIFNPVVTPELFEKAQETVEHPWFGPGKLPVVLGVGRLSPEKDFSTLIRAFALVRRERASRLVILGEGKERARLEGLVREFRLQNEVDLPGFVRNPFKYMARSGVFVLCSRWEGLGNALVEAMALGTPCVATDCPGGPREVLAGGKLGWLVPVGDMKGLANAILEALDNPPDRDSLREYAGRVFSAHSIVAQYDELLRSLAEET